MVPAQAVTIIRPKKLFSLRDLKEIWEYRELLYFFTWRDLKVRYKQTAIGVLWAIFRPFISMVVFTVFFGNLANIPSDGIPYPVFVYVGLLLWQFFSSSLSDASNSLIANQSIATKVYFPRIILPLSSTLTNFVDFFVSSIILVGMMVYYNFTPNLAGMLILPLLLFITFMIAVGGGLLLSAINVRYRDVRYVLPFFIQMLLFVTPVIYPASMLGKWSWVLAINPLTGVMKAARAALFGSEPINWMLIGLSAGAGFVLFVIGVYLFKKTERLFADIV